MLLLGANRSEQKVVHNANHSSAAAAAAAVAAAAAAAAGMPLQLHVGLLVDSIEQSEPVLVLLGQVACY